MSYYAASNILVDEIGTQQNFLRASIDGELSMLLIKRITSMSSVVDCSTELKALFMEMYPLFNR